MDVSAHALLRPLGLDGTNIHQHRLNALLRVVDAATYGRSLATTDLGRALANPTADKHRIKAVDRLVANPRLERERGIYYRAIAHHLIHGPHPTILVDWTPIEEGLEWTLLRAALATKDGRAIPICELAVTADEQQRPASHARFLDLLAQSLPKGCTPLLLTDAGFHQDWWKQVARRGWGFLTRIRGTHCVRLAEGSLWIDLPTLYAQTPPGLRDLGTLQITKKHQVPVRACLFRGKRTARVRKTRGGVRGRCSKDKVHERMWRDPWLLATNLPTDRLPAKAMVRQYQLRMQIEQAFRDTKSERFGLGLTVPKATSLVRLHNRLLLALLATWCLWVAGLSVRATGALRLLQSNTRTAVPTYSVPTLGRLIRRRAREWIHFPPHALESAVAELRTRCSFLTSAA